jgi:DNA-binding MarR family transcriptional regulator/GNAT superfamily N-acetyltransferase
VGEEREAVGVIRSFNRFWTEEIGLLNAGLLDTPYSLTEARIIFELAHADAAELADLRAQLGVDSGYLSRIMNRFKADGLVDAGPSPSDGRRQLVRLTGRGRAVFAMLDTRSSAEIGGLLERLGHEDRRRLLDALSSAQEILERGGRPKPYLVRPLQPGDLGWVVQRHGAVYAEEYGWDESFEALVAHIVADYVDHRDSSKDDAWIAELDGEPVGCVFCIHDDDQTAQLRLLLVEAKARGYGIGARLVDECIRFAADAGYTEMKLWTNDILMSARRIYEAAGFKLVDEERHHSYGHDLVGQTWWLKLAGVNGG